MSGSKLLVYVVAIVVVIASFVCGWTIVGASTPNTAPIMFTSSAGIDVVCVQGTKDAAFAGYDQNRNVCYYHILDGTRDMRTIEVEASILH